MGNKKKYPGVKFNKKLKKWITTYRNGGVVYVSTNNTFEEAKKSMIGFEKG